MRPIEAAHTRREPGGIEQLHVTEDSDPQWEKFYRTYYTPANLPERKTARLAAKLNRPPELVVFEKVGDEGKCHESGAELLTGDYLLMLVTEEALAKCGLGIQTCSDSFKKHRKLEISKSRDGKSNMTLIFKK